MKKEVYLLGSLLFLSLLGGLLYYNTVLVDTQAYVPSVYYLQGKSLGQEDIVRVTASYAFKRPVEIFVASFLEPFVGVRQAYSILNMILYIVTTLLFYYYLKKFFKKEETARREQLAYIGAVLYALSLPLILYATRVLVDVAGYLTILLGLFLIDWIFEKKEIKCYHHCLAGFSIGVFLLVRDSVVILIPYYGLLLLDNLKILNQINKIKSVLKAFIVVICFAFCLLMPEIVFIWYYNVGSVLSGKAAAITVGKYSFLGWLKFLIVHFAAFHIAYFFAYLGLKKEYDNKNDNKRKKFYIGYGIFALVYLIGIQLVALTSPRFSMVLFPVILPLAAMGILSLAEKMQTKIAVHKTILCCIFFYAIISFLGAWLYPSRTLILEDAGGNTVLYAVWDEIKRKIEVFFL